MAGFNQGKQAVALSALMDAILSLGQTLLINPSSHPEPGQSSLI